MPTVHASQPLAPSDWEALWAPYDGDTYRAALAFLEPGDTVLDIGAGDLRFARRAAPHVARIYAVERNPEILARSTRKHPPNLLAVCADALVWPFPEGLTAAVLLMRHCRHFREYLVRLRAAGCRRLITNARWGMGVECLPLEPQAPFAAAPAGWYACACGAVGFKAGPPEELSTGTLAATHSVEDCPDCLKAVSMQSWSRR